MGETVRIKSDDHPSGYIIVNADDPRAKQAGEKPAEKQEDQTESRVGNESRPVRATRASVYKGK